MWAKPILPSDLLSTSVSGDYIPKATPLKASAANGLPSDSLSTSVSGDNVPKATPLKASAANGLSKVQEWTALTLLGSKRVDEMRAKANAEMKRLLQEEERDYRLHKDYQLEQLQTQQRVKRKRKRKKPSIKIAGMTIEQHRRALGNQVKSKIKVEKWCIAPQCHCVMQCEIEVFRKLIVPNAQSVMPSTFDATTAVVVASIEGSEAAGAVFGYTKICGGTRLGSWSANKMELIFFPRSKEMRVWWTMR